MLCQNDGTCAKQGVTFQQAIILTPSWALCGTLMWKIIICPPPPLGLFVLLVLPGEHFIRLRNETCYAPSQYPVSCHQHSIKVFIHSVQLSWADSHARCSDRVLGHVSILTMETESGSEPLA